MTRSGEPGGRDRAAAQAFRAEGRDVFPKVEIGALIDEFSREFDPAVAYEKFREPYDRSAREHGDAPGHHMDWIDLEAFIGLAEKGLERLQQHLRSTKDGRMTNTHIAMTYEEIARIVMGMEWQFEQGTYELLSDPWEPGGPPWDAAGEIAFHFNKFLLRKLVQSKIEAGK